MQSSTDMILPGRHSHETVLGASLTYAQKPWWLTLSKCLFPWCSPNPLFSRFPWYPHPHILCVLAKGLLITTSHSLNSYSKPLLLLSGVLSHPFLLKWEATDNSLQFTDLHPFDTVTQLHCLTVVCNSSLPHYLNFLGSLHPPQLGTQCLINVFWI